MPDLQEVKRVADIVNDRIQSGQTFLDAARAVIREEVPRGERSEFFTAVASELSGRKHLQEARALPDAGKRKTPGQESRQLGLDFGEGPRTKIRPPSRRHL